MKDMKSCARGESCPNPVAGKIGKPVKDDADPSVYVCLEHGIEAHNRLFDVEWLDGDTHEGLMPLISLIYAKHRRVTGLGCPRTDSFGRWLPGASTQMNLAKCHL